MKELSIEEKAKTYDEAIAHAKLLLKTIGYATLGNLVLKNEFENMFPELAESGDERIRKELIEGFKRYDDGALFNGCLIREILALLEEQCENISLPKFTFDDVLALQCAMEAAKKVQKDKDLYEQLKSLHDRLHDAYWLKKQGEQSKKHNVCDNCEQQCSCVSPCPMKLVEKHGEQKPAWGKEDERYLSYAIHAVEDMLGDNGKNIVAWLKSLRPQNGWKPSDEQFKVLNEVLNFAANHESPHWNDYIFGTLNNLIRQLKKLREK